MFAVITPARNEEQTLSGLAVTVSKQTRAPGRWLIVDDGSTDGTRELAGRIGELLPYVAVTEAPAAAGDLNAGARRGRDVAAFSHGAGVVGPVDFIGKLDADVLLCPGYYERLLREFEQNPRLGVSGGVCYEGGDRVCVTAGHVRGAARLYRWECWLAVQPLPCHLGWDGLDLVKARLAGWETYSVEVPFDHLRPVGARG